MPRGLVSLLSLFLLSLTGGAAFRFPLPLPIGPGTVERHAIPSGSTRHVISLSLQSTTITAADEDRLRAEGLGGDERARLAERIAEEFGAQTAMFKAAYEAELEQQKASHRLALAQQRVNLLEVRCARVRRSLECERVRERAESFCCWCAGES